MEVRNERGKYREVLFAMDALILCEKKYGDSVCLCGLTHLLEVDLEAFSERNQVCEDRTWGEFSDKLTERMRRNIDITGSLL